MAEPNVHKGPWTHRALVHLFTVILTILIYWLLGFVVGDIGSLPGPSYKDLEKRLLDQKLVRKAEDLESQIARAERTIKDQQKRQKLLRDSTNNSQRTMNQLLEIQRLSLRKNVKPTAEEQSVLAESEQLFLSNQKRYQVLNEEIANLNEQLRELQEEQRATEKTLEEQRKPVHEEYKTLIHRHRMKMAALKLSFLLPLLIAAGVLFLRQRYSVYVCLVYALGIASLVKVAVVMHEYFPARYFKYVLIAAALAVVTWILVYLLRMIAAPKMSWLLKQYREAYQSFFCPVCGYPIRRGPLKYMAWNRRSIKAISALPTATAEQEKPYTCPVCATRLYEECESCHAIRHSLLPACDRCGAVKPLQ